MLHKFAEAKEYPDAFVEWCVLCGDKRIYRKDASGRIDNKLYLRAHYRSFVQPYGASGQAFRSVYGEKAYWNAMKNKAWKKPVDWDEATDDAKRYLRELKKDKTLN